MSIEFRHMNIIDDLGQGKFCEMAEIILNLFTSGKGHYFPEMVKQ